ncbi:hypothetical protein E1293_19210 [Actinomadura darangshiensis]|uniref:Tn3 transposase DDE domain-containing protein n=1 Tax=Actinomadura darangshiensis TaxID=705336 RepID=A0A4R5B746_9ACTN|nr:hypothetical protein E1293_19210 [Actinomadura darangshiensis]
MKSEIGFGITRLLNIDLLPCIKRINKVRLYRPAAGHPRRVSTPGGGADPADQLGRHRLQL